MLLNPLSTDLNAMRQTLLFGEMCIRDRMTVLDEHIAHHRHVHALYENAFEGVDGITLKSNPDGLSLIHISFRNFPPYGEDGNLLHSSGKMKEGCWLYPSQSRAAVNPEVFCRPDDRRRHDAICPPQVQKGGHGE